MTTEENNKVIPFIPPLSDDSENTIKFWCKSDESKFPVLELGPKDEIRVRGKLIERDYEVVEALRHFVTHGVIKVD